MDLSDLLGEETPNEHQIAWLSRDWDKVKELSKQFKTSVDVLLFQIVDNVTKKTGYKFDEFDVTGGYDQYMINNVLSQHIELRGYAYELNSMIISDRMHYDYMYYSIRKTSLAKVKFAKIEDEWETRVIERMLADYYQVSHERGAEYMKLLSEQQLDYMKAIFSGIIEDNENLNIIPTKTERMRILTTIKNYKTRK